MAALRPLALALQELGLPLANLRQHQSAEVRAMELQAWAEGEASVLLATDAACAGLDLRQPGSVLVHADLSWNPALMAERLARLSTEDAGVPAWAWCWRRVSTPLSSRPMGRRRPCRLACRTGRPVPFPSSRAPTSPPSWQPWAGPWSC